MSAVAYADQLGAAWQAGYDHGARGGGRHQDPHVHGDRDLHIAWDEGWIAGSDCATSELKETVRSEPGA